VDGNSVRKITLDEGDIDEKLAEGKVGKVDSVEEAYEKLESDLE